VSRAARVCAGWATGLAAVALALGGCGSTAVRHAGIPVSYLCIAVGLPTSGTDSVTGRAALTGLEEEFPAGGIHVDGYRIRLCNVGYRAGRSPMSPVQALLRNVVRAASNKLTIAYVGALSGAQANDADAVLAQAGIALITPSGPVPDTSAPTRRTGSGQAATAPRTAFSLLPSESSQGQARVEIELTRGCEKALPRRAPNCEVITGEPLCSGFAALSRPRPQRLCVLAGPDLSSFSSPAVAYGEGAGTVLRDALMEVGAGSGDIASRGAILRALTHEDLKQSPIGPIHFDRTGEIMTDTYTVYTVEQDGRLVGSQSFPLH
jgi:hypothetical protein